MSLLPENDPSARIQRRNRAELQMPGSCYVCGFGTDERGFLDFGTFVDYHGNFYLCVTCTEQASLLIGYAPPHVMEEIAKRVTSLEEELELTKKELADAREHIESVNTVLSSRFTASSSNGLGIPSSKDAEGPLQPTENPFARAASGESEPEESVKGSDSTGIAGIKPRDTTGKRNIK